MNMQHLTFFLQMTGTPLDVLSDTQYNRYPRKHDSLSLSLSLCSTICTESRLVVWGVGEGRERSGGTQGCFGGWWIVYTLGRGDGSSLYTNVKTQQTVYFSKVQIIVLQLYLNKVVFKFSKVQVPLHTVHWYLLVKLTTVSRFSGAMHALLEVICNGRREAQA